MANKLGKDLTGRAVVIDATVLKPEYADAPRRVFVVSGGFGAMPFTTGNAVFGAFLADEEKCRVEGWMVERFATDEEIEAAKRLREETQHGAIA